MDRAHVKRDFTIEQICQLVQALGSVDYRRESPEGAYQFQTICHNPPGCGSYKLYYYPDSGQFHCYTHCAENFDVYALVMRSRHCSFFEALRFIQGVLGIALEQHRGFMDKPEEPVLDDWEVLNRYAARRQRATQNTASPLIPTSILDYYTDTPILEWEREGISPETMKHYGIRFSIADNEAIIPHFDRSGALVGIRSRSFDPAKIAAGCKYMPTVLEGQDFRHALRNHLYGLNIVQDTIQHTGKVCLVEAEESAMQSYTMYGKDSFTVAVCGSNISTIQRDLVLSLGVREVYLAMDKEYQEAYTEASDKYAEKLLKLASLFTPYVTTWVLFDTEGLLGYKDSPTDKGKDVFEKLMKNKFEIETKEGKKRESTR